MDGYAQAENERVAAENERISAEAMRVSHEIERIQGEELRIYNESQRMAAEEQRRLNTTTAINAAYAAVSSADVATRTAMSAAQSANTAAQFATDAATLANTKAGLADTAAQNADTATTAANNAASAATTAAEQADAAREAIQDDLAAKADKDGYYQQLTAGLADTVAGDTTEVVQFAQRTSDHDGMVDIQSLRGNTVVWNQIVEDTDDSVSIQNTHVYVARINGVATRGVSDNTALAVVGGRDNVYDLTRMFGAGNEPATVAEFEALFPESYYPYDAGSLLSVNIEGIESAGMTRDMPVSTYFHDGLRSAGTAYDELDFVQHKAVKRIEEVTLLPSSWAAYDTVDDLWYHNQGNMMTQTTSTITRIVSDVYSTTSDDSVNQPANTIRCGNANKRIYLKTAEGEQPKETTVMFELATPIESALPENLQSTYPVEIGGTESIIIPTGEQSTSPTMAIVYAYNADGVRDISQAIVANIEGNTASTNYAIGGYFVHAGKLYKTTSAIATGETINPGTNCTATTVMAELVALTA